MQSVPLTMDLLTIGRLPDNGLVLADQAVSRHHAELRRVPSGFVLTDLGSSNGTIVGGTRLPTNQPHLLTGGAVIEVGPFTLVYQAPPPPPPPEPPPVDATIDEGVGPEVPPEIPPEVPVEVSPPEEPRAVEPEPPLVVAESVEPAVSAEVVAPPAEAEAESAEPEPAAPEPEPMAAEPQPPPPPPRPTYPRPLAEGPGSRYLRYLPIIYHDNEFLGRYLMIMESIWEPLEQRQDHVDMYFDPWTCPERLIAWLASWLSLSLNEHWPEERRRRLLSEAMDLYRWRGTRYGLTRMIEICTGLTPEIAEAPDSGDGAQPNVFHVSLTVPRGSGVTRELVESLIQTHKPAHAGYVLELKS